MDFTWQVKGFITIPNVGDPGQNKQTCLWPSFLRLFLFSLSHDRSPTCRFSPPPRPPPPRRCFWSTFSDVLKRLFTQISLINTYPYQGVYISTTSPLFCKCLFDCFEFHYAALTLMFFPGLYVFWFLPWALLFLLFLLRIFATPLCITSLALGRPHCLSSASSDVLSSSSWAS
jgi:hypothetical protein